MSDHSLSVTSQASLVPMEPQGQTRNQFCTDHVRGGTDHVRGGTWKSASMQYLFFFAEVFWSFFCWYILATETFLLFVSQFY